MKPYRSQLPTPPQFLARHIIIKLIKAGVDPDTLDIQEIDPLNPFSSLERIISLQGRRNIEDLYMPEEIVDRKSWEELWEAYRRHIESRPELKKKRVMRRVYSRMEDWWQ